MEVSGQGQHVQPLSTLRTVSRDQALAAETFTWWKRYIVTGMRNVPGSTERTSPEYEALRLWIRTQLHQTADSQNHILENRARASERSPAAMKRAFFRRVNAGIRLIKLGLLADRVFVEDVADVRRLSHRTKKPLGDVTTMARGTFPHN